MGRVQRGLQKAFLRALPGTDCSGCQRVGGQRAGRDGMHRRISRKGSQRGMTASGRSESLAEGRVRPGADVSSAVRNLYRYRVRQRALLAGFVARHSDRAPSLRELKLPQKRLVARIAGEPAQKSVAFDVHQTAVALGMGALEPL